MCSNLPAWKRLTSYPLSVEAPIRLITSIFSNREDVEVVGRLSGDDAQTFIDAIDKVNFYTIPHLQAENKLVDPDQNIQTFVN